MDGKKHPALKAIEKRKYNNGKATTLYLMPGTGNKQKMKNAKSYK